MQINSPKFSSTLVLVFNTKSENSPLKQEDLVCTYFHPEDFRRGDLDKSIEELPKPDKGKVKTIYETNMHGSEYPQSYYSGSFMFQLPQNKKEETTMTIGNESFQTYS